MYTASSCIFVSLLLSSSSFHPTPTTEIYTLSLHDALPVSSPQMYAPAPRCAVISTSPNSPAARASSTARCNTSHSARRSEEHTSELQSLTNLVCRLLLEKKKTLTYKTQYDNWCI